MPCVYIGTYTWSYRESSMYHRDKHTIKFTVKATKMLSSKSQVTLHSVRS